MKKLETKIKNRILSCTRFGYEYDVGKTQPRTYATYLFSDFKVKVYIEKTDIKRCLDHEGISSYDLLKLKNNTCTISLYVYENGESENSSVLSYDEAKHLNDKLKVFVLKDIKSRIRADNEERQKQDEERQKRNEEIRQNKLECL